MRGPGAHLTGGTPTAAAELYVSRKAYAHNPFAQRHGVVLRAGFRICPTGSVTVAHLSAWCLGVRRFHATQNDA